MGPSLKKRTLSLLSEKKNGSSDLSENSKDGYSPPARHSPPPPYHESGLADYDLSASIRKLHLATSSSFSGTSLPSNDECIAHLKLLTSFVHLREEISETDGLWDLHDSLAKGMENLAYNPKLRLPARPPPAAKIREKRWGVYVTRAVDRFQRWWEVLVSTQGRQRLQLLDCLTPGALQRLMRDEPSMRWREDMLPPLDVLMVLHSFMLNPRDFLEDCLRAGMLPLWKAGFPWEYVNSAIDNKSFDYTPSDDAISNFESKTKLSWGEDLSSPPTKIIACIECGSESGHPYTDAHCGSDPERAFESGRGYADKSFETKCANCGLVTNHESLRLGKFYNDMQSLLHQNVPMPGTVLSIDGVPLSATEVNETKHEVFFPNRLILAGLGSTLLAVSKPGHAAGEPAKVEDIRHAIEEGIKDKSLLRKANGPSFSKSLKRLEKIAIRRMLSHYWHNSSIFDLDLTGAVLRQGVFVEKMKSIDWIHSPALENTMTRTLKKYVTFFKIMELNKGRVAVPTLDVDLAWHTHQLTPPSYMAYSLAHANDRFIDHDDKIDQHALNTAFEWTSRQYQKITGGEIYSECTCWYCEAIRESNISLSLFSKGLRNAALALHDRKDISSDPNKNPHISAHNAVTGQSLIGERLSQSQRWKLEADYERAVKKAQKAGKTPPDRSSYNTAYVWGYPMFIPCYIPYGADPCVTSQMYPCEPGYMNTMPGGVGNCVSGACGGSVAQGGCAGAFGGCAGGQAGGCGGGIGGGCGGGCGGGGGGCGGGGC